MYAGAWENLPCACNRVFEFESEGFLQAARAKRSQCRLAVISFSVYYLTPSLLASLEWRC